MPSARLFATVPHDQHDRLAQLAFAKGLTVPRLMAGLVEKALADNPTEKVARLLAQSQDDRAPAEKYTVRLMGLDAARLEERALARGVTASGYVVHLLRAHLRANPPMPYQEFQDLKRVVNELSGVRGALQQLVAEGARADVVEQTVRENVLRLLPALKGIRDQIQEILIVNSKSWEVPMPKGRPFRVARDEPGGINPGSYGRKGPPNSSARWTAQMGASARGAKEVMVKISGGGRDADGVQAHLEYIDRHGKLELETDLGEKLQGKQAATTLINEWGLDYGKVPGAPHSRGPVDSEGKRVGPRQAFNIVLSMPAGTPPQAVLAAAKKFAREEFAHQHRYAMTLHAEQKDGHGKHPHVHLVVKAEHEYGGLRLNPRKADLQRWRESFAEHLTELGVAATATRRYDRGLVKTGKKTPIYRAAQRAPKPIRPAAPVSLYTGAGDSVFMRKKLEAVKRELRGGGSAEAEQYRSLLNVRAQVDERYRDAIDWLRQQGREGEARRFELMHRHLAPVRTENQLIADAMLANAANQARRGIEAPRTR